MLIGELVRLTNLSKDTIRFYEREKLISLEKKERRSNNYKEYSEQVLQKLLIIKRIKNFGFTLAETKEFLDLIDLNSASCDSVSNKMLEKVSIIETKISELEELKKLMLNGISNCKNDCQPKTQLENCKIIINDKLVKR